MIRYTKQVSLVKDKSAKNIVFINSPDYAELHNKRLKLGYAKLKYTAVHSVFTGNDILSAFKALLTSRVPAIGVTADFDTCMYERTKKVIFLKVVYLQERGILVFQPFDFLTGTPDIEKENSYALDLNNGFDWGNKALLDFICYVFPLEEIVKLYKKLLGDGRSAKTLKRAIVLRNNGMVTAMKGMELDSLTPYMVESAYGYFKNLGILLSDTLQIVFTDALVGVVGISSSSWGTVFVHPRPNSDCSIVTDFYTPFSYDKGKIYYYTIVKLLVHEIAHHVDSSYVLNNIDEMGLTASSKLNEFASKESKDFIKDYKESIMVSRVPVDKRVKTYFCKPSEIIARTFEVLYLTNSVKELEFIPIDTLEGYGLLPHYCKLQNHDSLVKDFLRLVKTNYNY